MSRFDQCSRGMVRMGEAEGVMMAGEGDAGGAAKAYQAAGYFAAVACLWAAALSAIFVNKIN